MPVSFTTIAHWSMAVALSVCQYLPFMKSLLRPCTLDFSALQLSHACTTRRRTGIGSSAILSVMLGEESKPAVTAEYVIKMRSHRHIRPRRKFFLTVTTSVIPVGRISRMLWTLSIAESARLGWRAVSSAILFAPVHTTSMQLDTWRSKNPKLSYWLG